jgi:hypothetical protein
MLVLSLFAISAGSGDPNRRRRGTVSDVYKWESDKSAITNLALRCWAREVARQRAQSEVVEDSSLAAAFAAEMKRKQDLNLISRVYEFLGIYARPISGGKFELKKRHKLF